MKNLEGFKIDSRLEGGMFYLMSQYVDNVKDYIKEVYEGDEKDFRDSIEREERQCGRDSSKEIVDEIVEVMKDWFEYKKLLTSRSIENQEVVSEEDLVLIIKNERCKMWIEVDSENGGFVVHKDTHTDYDDRDEYDGEYSEESFESDIVKEYTYEELNDGIEVDGIGFDVWIGNDSKTGGSDGLRLVFRKL